MPSTLAGEDATDVLREDPRGILQLTGIAGSDPKEEEEGTGSLRMTIEYAYNKTILDQKQKAKAAGPSAEADFKRIYNPVTDAIAAGIDAKDAVRLRGLDMGAQVEDFNIHSNNQNINPDTLVVGGGGNVGVFAGGGRRGNQRSNQAPSDQESAEASYRDTGVWPSWWDPQAKRRI